MTRNLNIKKKIEDFLKEYNKAKYYSYILVYDPGFIYYKDETYNITADVIKGLNEEYRKKKE
jgi:outer membrane protein